MVILEIHCDACLGVKRYRVFNEEDPLQALECMGWDLAGSIHRCPDCNEKGEFPEVRVSIPGEGSYDDVNLPIPPF